MSPICAGTTSISRETWRRASRSSELTGRAALSERDGSGLSAILLGARSPTLRKEHVYAPPWRAFSPLLPVGVARLPIGGPDQLRRRSSGQAVGGERRDASRPDRHFPH